MDYFKNMEYQFKWMWWMGLVILIIGGIVAYHLSQQQVNMDARRALRMVVMLTVLGSGLSFIIPICEYIYRQ